MNIDILEKYNISFLTDANGNKFPDGKTALSSYLFIWRDTDDIEDFLTDIDNAISGNFDLITERYYNGEGFGNYGELTPDSLILSDQNNLNKLVIPLPDFKEILLSWKEYLFINNKAD